MFIGTINLNECPVDRADLALAVATAVLIFNPRENTHNSPQPRLFQYVSMIIVNTVHKITPFQRNSNMVCFDLF